MTRRASWLKPDVTAAERRRRLAGVIAAGALAVIIAALTVVFFHGLADYADVRQSTNVPRCTDLIADAGGICRGGDPLPPCPTEDSDNCFWDAATRSNGRGLSFTIERGVATYSDGTVIDWNEEIR